MLEDSDCASNTSTMSDASTGQVLQDVQDVQNVARMQEESKIFIYERLTKKQGALEGLACNGLKGS